MKKMGHGHGCHVFDENGGKYLLFSFICSFLTKPCIRFQLNLIFNYRDIKFDFNCRDIYIYT